MFSRDSFSDSLSSVFSCYSSIQENNNEPKSRDEESVDDGYVQQADSGSEAVDEFDGDEQYFNLLEMLSAIKYTPESKNAKRDARLLELARG
jgi:hypothetical protein